MRFLQFIAVTLLALICALTPARAEKRVALVVRNGAYVHAGKLGSAGGVPRALAISEKTLGPEHPYTAYGLSNL